MLYIVFFCFARVVVFVCVFPNGAFCCSVFFCVCFLLFLRFSLRFLCIFVIWPELNIVNKLACFLGDVLIYPSW